MASGTAGASPARAGICASPTRRLHDGATVLAGTSSRQAPRPPRGQHASPDGDAEMGCVDERGHRRSPSRGAASRGDREDREIELSRTDMGATSAGWYAPHEPRRSQRRLRHGRPWHRRVVASLPRSAPGVDARSSSALPHTVFLLLRGREDPYTQIGLQLAGIKAFPVAMAAVASGSTRRGRPVALKISTSTKRSRGDDFDSKPLQRQTFFVNL